MTEPVQTTNIFDSRIEAGLSAAAVQVQLQFKSLTELVNQRVDNNRERSQHHVTELRSLLETKIDGVSALVFARFTAEAEARVLQAKEYERRLEALNHEHERLDRMGSTYVRDDIYAKDMERIYTERQQQLTASETARVAAETSANNNRRGTMLTLLTVGVSVVLSVVLHFLPGSPGVK